MGTNMQARHASADLWVVEQDLPDAGGQVDLERPQKSTFVLGTCTQVLDHAHSRNLALQCS